MSVFNELRRFRFSCVLRTEKEKWGAGRQLNEAKRGEKMLPVPEPRTKGGGPVACENGEDGGMAIHGPKLHFTIRVKRPWMWTCFLEAERQGSGEARRD